MSKAAREVALNIVTLGVKPGIVEATAKLLVASGAVGATAVRWSHSRKMVPVYKAFDWMLPGQFEAFGHRLDKCPGVGGLGRYARRGGVYASYYVTNSGK